MRIVTIIRNNNIANLYSSPKKIKIFLKGIKIKAKIPNRKRPQKLNRKSKGDGFLVMTNKNTEWRDNTKKYDSDEDSAYQSQNNSTLNESILSASSAIENNFPTISENNVSIKTPETPRRAQISGRLFNLKLNEENPDEEISNMAQNGDRLPRNNGIGPIHQAVSNLPYFDGNPRMLRQFIASLQHLHDSYGEDFDPWILTYIPNRLKGRALMAFGGNASTYENINDFLEAVKTEFGGIHDLDTLRMELYQVEQDENETVSEYSARVKDIEQRLLAAYGATLNPDQQNQAQDPIKQRLLEDILEAFLHGLKNPPEYQVAIKNPTSLAEASRYAETLEKKQQFIMGHRNVVKAKNNSPNKTKLRDQEEVDNDSVDEKDDIALLIKLMKEWKDTANINIASAPKMAENKKQSIDDRLICKFCNNKGHEMNFCQLLLQIVEQNMNKLRYSAGIEFYKDEMVPFESNSFNPFNRNFFENRNFYPNFNADVNTNRFLQGPSRQNYQNYNNFRKNDYINSNRNNFTRNSFVPRYFEPSRFRNYTTGSRFRNDGENFNRFRSAPHFANNNENVNQLRNEGQNYLNYSRQSKNESPGNFRQTIKNYKH